MVWPERLFEGDAHGLWWVLHVKPRSEKALARRCAGKQASFFLPQYRQLRKSQGRVRDSYLPLFPGYLFLFGDERDRLTALETNLVVNVLSVANQRELFEDLKRINRVIESGLPMLPGERLRPGAAVMITDGPLAGMHGHVIREKNKLTLILKVSFLQQGAPVEIDRWMVEPLPAPLKV